METKPTAQEALKRLSSGFSLSESSNYVMSPKDDKSLKIATFSLQGYLKVGYPCLFTISGLIKHLGKRFCYRVFRKRRFGITL